MSLLTGGLGEGGGLIALGGGIEIELEEDQQLLTQEILSTRPSITTVRGSSKSSQKSERKNYKIEWDTKQKLVPDNYKIVAQLLEINGKIMEIPISGKSILYFERDEKEINIIVEKIQNNSNKINNEKIKINAKLLK